MGEEGNGVVPSGHHLDTYYEAFSLVAAHDGDFDAFGDVLTGLSKGELVHMMHALVLYIEHRLESPEAEHLEAVEFVLRVAHRAGQKRCDNEN